MLPGMAYVTAPRRSELVLLAALSIGVLGSGVVAAPVSLYAQAPAPRGEKVVVVELYTSQGCASCLPADALQAELADRNDVLPLTFPVDYWDYLGWHDTLARAGNSKRQMAYAQQSRTAQVFTPQMIIDGTYSAIASRREEVLARIADRAASAGQRVPISLSVNGAHVVVALPAVREVADHPNAKVSVWLFPFAQADVVHISDGENRGRSVRYTHVVRDIVMLGEWDGKAATYEYSLDPRDRGQFGYAVVVQNSNLGPVLGAAWAGNRADLEQRGDVPLPPPISADPLLVDMQR